MSVELTEHPDGIYVRARDYVVWLPADRPYALVTDPDGTPWAELFLAWSLHTSGTLDDTMQLAAPTTRSTDDGQQIVVRCASTAWTSKQLVLDCLPDELRLAVTVEGSGDLTDVHLLGGYYSGDIRHASGYHASGTDFLSVCNPEPWGSERRVLPAGESTILDVLGSSVPGKEHWLFTPPPLCLPVSRQRPPTDTEQLPDGPWTSIGLDTEPGRNTFTALHYEAVEAAFSLRLAYEGQTAVQGTFTTPTVTLRFGAQDPYEAIAVHAAGLRSRGHAPATEPSRRVPRWWREPIFCGWGSQCVLSGLEGGDPQEHANAATYDRFLAALADQDLHPGTVVLDDKWQRTYAGWEADESRWPDLTGWIRSRHDQGQRVLLWWKAWDPEGLPEELCVRNRLGVPVSVDPTNPAYEQHLRETVRQMLGPDGYDADGFKVDFSARTPSGPGLERHGEAWGIELLHRLLGILYDEAKRTKPDALVMTHTPNPYFTDVTDMIRLNDVNTRAPVVAQMTHRANVARAACPDLLVDTDNWPIPDPDTFRDYVRAQPDLGIPSLYYATHLDAMPPWTKGRGHVRWPGFQRARVADGAVPTASPEGRAVEMTDEDYATIRRAWAAAREAVSAGE